MKRYFITAAVFLVVVSGYTSWRENCVSQCQFEKLVLGWPVFLRTPVVAHSSQQPEFSLVPFMINVVWTAAVAVSLWAIIDTLERWQDRRRSPPAP